ncbi:MAG: acyl-CoA dehydratase activase [Candidatus Kapaibacteriales bacterium]
MKKYFGVCVGSATISIVGLEYPDLLNPFLIHTQQHYGNPKELFIELLKKYNPEGFPTIITGRKFRHLIRTQTITETEAVEVAFQNLYCREKDYSAVASLGSETFIVYLLDKNGYVLDIITKNQCASGTGEFFLQQIKRMGLDIDDISNFSFDVKPFRVSGRCSVFCKSDCTHALNRGVPKPEVLSGLALMIAEKIEELVRRIGCGKVLLIGGVTRNQLVMKFLQEKGVNFKIAKEATYFEAYGSAIYALKRQLNTAFDLNNYLIHKKSSFVFFPPLRNFEHLVEFKNFERGIANDGDECIIGLDVGSTTTKGVVIRVSDSKIIASEYIYTLADPINASRKVYRSLYEQLKGKKLKFIGLGTTGSGRQIAGLHAMTEGIYNEIIAHSKAALFFDKNVDTIFEIGGQDAKYTHIINGVPADYAMNEACSAGTGSFIEESAFESFGIKTTELEKIAFLADSPPNFNDQCSAFINSDVKTALNEGLSKENIIAGLVFSICQNYVNRVKGNRPIGNVVFMQGGVCYNRAISVAMAALIGKKIIVPPEPGLMGAFGVALQVKEKIELNLLEKKTFLLEELMNREVSYKPPFICNGSKENCDLGCQINRVIIESRTYPFGGACNKYYNLIYQRKVDLHEYDYIADRNDIVFKKYLRTLTANPNAPSIGLNLSYHNLTLFPLFYNFFTELGFKVVVPDYPDERGFEREFTSFCYPAQISLCLFQNLIDKNPDYFFLPEIFEMWTDETYPQRLDFNCSCVFVSGEPLYLRQAFKDYYLDGKIISVYLNFANGFENELGKFINISKKLGISDESKVRNAYSNAVKIQVNVFNEFQERGKHFLNFLAKDKSKFAVVLVGRPYNSFFKFANKGIPQKFASRGVYIIPYEYLPYQHHQLDESQFWEAGKKILKVAKEIRENPQLFPVYVTNFSCGPDSMLIPQFRKILGDKPSLTLELDQHTADAGINTRIDAFLDIVENYRNLNQKVKIFSIPAINTFKIAQIDLSDSNPIYICSDGTKIPLNSKEIEILIPAMGDLAAPLFAASLRGLGFNAISLPESNSEILKLGRSVTSGKECLPLILMVGSLLYYIEKIWDKQKKIAFFIVQGAGNCRLGQYPVLIRNLIRERKIKDVATLVLMNEDGFAGLGPDFALRGINAIIASDVLDDIRSGIMATAKDPDYGLKIFYEEYEKLLLAFEKNPKMIYSALKNFAIVIRKKVPANVPIENFRYIAMCGEIYVRRDHFAHRYLNKFFAKNGFILKDAYISEWIYYVDYLLKLKLLEPETAFRKKLERWLRVGFMRISEHKIKKALALSGYYKYSKTLVEPLLNHSKHIIPLEYKGEPGLTLGTALWGILEKYCGVVNIGPFGCMPTRIAESVSVPEMNLSDKIKIRRINEANFQINIPVEHDMRLPFITIETDGNPYPQVIEAKLESFLLQAKRVAEIMEKQHNHGRK